MRNVIIGGGPAGYNAAKALRAAGEEVTLISQENVPYYSRVLITHFLGDLKPRENVFLAGQDCYQALGVTAKMGRQAVAVDAASRKVALDNGEVLLYDNLLVASGSKPYIPPIQGTSLPGVFSLYTLNDAENIKQWIHPGEAVVIIGGGLVSLKGLEALLEMDVKISLVEIMDHILPQMLDARAANILEDALQQAGVDLYLANSVRSIEGDGRVERVCLKDGRILPCQMVIIGTGVKPALDFLEGTGVKIDRGVVVDKYLQSSVPGIYAAGDAAAAYDVIYGDNRVNALWPVAVTQGRLAGINMAGGRKPYSGSTGFNTLELLGLRFVSFGFINAPEGYQEAASFPPGGQYYRKLIYKGNVIKGGVLVNDIEGTGILYWLASSGLAVDRVESLVQVASARYRYIKVLNDRMAAGM
ncbi:MAG: hypothetical protein PWQ18_969 [Clostridia bacterium]|nr:hypothetical protein [Clostridia bacterium]